MTGVLPPLHRRLPLALERPGVARPHLAVGLAVGVAYAAATLPVWRGEAQRRVARLEDCLPPTDDEDR